MSMIIKLVRHGESQANVGAVQVEKSGDPAVELTENGKGQALAAGATIGAEFIQGALTFCSPYTRTRMTLDGILAGAGQTRQTIRVFEDPRLREVDPGYVPRHEQEELRKTHGWFYYRFSGGESPADCYDRTSGFLESMMRQVNRKDSSRVLIVTHGLTIRCFVMRFLHLTVENFDSMSNPHNCDVITLAPKEMLAAPQFTSGRWGVEGLRIREEPR